MAEDDATMPDTVEKVAERLAQLEKTVAEGFHDTNARISLLDRRLEVSVEMLQEKIATVLELTAAFRDEMRRTALSTRKGDAGAFEVLKLSVQDHERRLKKLELADSLRAPEPGEDA